MLSYRHGFHAGNFADVFKHVILVQLIKSLLRKDKPFCYLDTHAGTGLYDLSSGMARKNREYDSGISRLWPLAELPEEIADYLAVVRTYNPSATLSHYPGSPCITRHLLRPDDRMLLCDLHSTEIEHLKTNFSHDKQVGVHHVDAYQAMKAFLPPKERRGLVLCDPAFELRDERNRLLEALTLAWRRWPTGIYAVWYPIQDRAAADWFHRQLKRSGIEKVWMGELRIFSEDIPLRLNGSGIIVVNPPWKLDEQMGRVGPWLWRALSPEGEGGFHMDWLVPE